MSRRNRTVAYTFEEFLQNVSFLLAIGAMFAMPTGSNTPALLFFIFIKILVDTSMHIKRHKRLAEIPQAAS